MNGKLTSGSSKKCKISVVIPTYNRPRRLAACLASFQRLHIPDDGFELIVVDDGSDVDLQPFVESVIQTLNVRLVKQSNTGPAGARNKGVETATGEFILFTDDDCEPTNEWLATLVNCMRQDPTKVYGGYSVNKLPDNIYSTTSQSLIDYLYSHYNADPKQARFFTSNNIVMTRTTFEAIGGFNPDFPGAGGEDREFCDRLLHLGRKMSYVPEARLLHFHKLTLVTFWKQHFNYGLGAFHFQQVKALRENRPSRFEPLSFYVGLITHPWQKKLRHRILISALMVVTQLANALGYFWAKFIGKHPAAGLRAQSPEIGP